MGRGTAAAPILSSALKQITHGDIGFLIEINFGIPFIAYDYSS
jgi:hypothetical protein